MALRLPLSQRRAGLTKNKIKKNDELLRNHTMVPRRGMSRARTPPKTKNCYGYMGLDDVVRRGRDLFNIVGQRLNAALKVILATERHSVCLCDTVAPHSRIADFIPQIVVPSRYVLVEVSRTLRGQATHYGVIDWWPERESNPRYQNQGLVCCRYTIRLFPLPQSLLLAVFRLPSSAAGVFALFHSADSYAGGGH